MTESNANTAAWGEVHAAVWPAWVGFSIHDPGVPPIPYGEPTDPIYQRGQIFWATETIEKAVGPEIVGRAHVTVPATHALFPYTHQLFFTGPEGNCMVGKFQLDQPLRVVTAGATIECYPIRNPNMQLLKTQGVDY